ncbi:MAG: UPF0175 family protein [Anaerolineales bacterium]|nr:UPF0175 family protein [Anaerolineales bacterium]
MEITINLPEKQFMTESPAQVASKIQLYAAFGLYQTGEISVGAACELAGVDRYTFLALCKQHGLVLLTQTPDELEADFLNL